MYEGDFNLVTDYCGRGMWSGDTCIGLIGSLYDLLNLWSALTLWFEEEEDVETVCELARAIQSDNMGHSTIYYFPGWTVGS